MNDTEFFALLDPGLAGLAITLSPTQQQQLFAYHQLLLKWNKVYNLTAVSDPQAVITRHLLDSLTLYHYLDGQHFIDVGSGAGLPGLILAIACPAKQFDLLDSNGKKTRFLQQVVIELELANVAVYHRRVEQHIGKKPYDGVVSRAFAQLSDMLRLCDHLVDADGRFYAMKGVYPADELDNLPPQYHVDSYPLSVPGEGERHLVIVEKAKSHLTPPLRGSRQIKDAVRR